MHIRKNHGIARKNEADLHALTWKDVRDKLFNAKSKLKSKVDSNIPLL